MVSSKLIHYLNSKQYIEKRIFLSLSVVTDMSGLGSSIFFLFQLVFHNFYTNLILVFLLKGSFSPFFNFEPFFKMMVRSII
jgi:hypothetical protein